MRNFLTLWRRELGAYFKGPTAYVAGVVVLAVVGVGFWSEVASSRGQPVRLERLLFWPLTVWLMVLAVSAVLTMRLFAEERRAGTLETLMTAPVTELQVVLGKYAGALTVYVLVLAPTALYPWILRRFSSGLAPVDPWALAAGYTILLLIGAFDLSIGLLMSALARSQVVAAVASFAALTLVFCAGLLPPLFRSPMGAGLEYVSSFQHIMDFSRGVVSTNPFVFYLSGTTLILFATVKAIESRRWT